MKLPAPKAVKNSRTPRYPGFHEKVDVGELLRTNVPKLFSPLSMAVLALMGWKGGEKVRAADEMQKTQLKVDAEDVRGVFNKFLKEAGFAELKEGETIQADDRMYRTEKSVLPANPDVLSLGVVMEPKMMSPMVMPKVDLMKKAAMELFELYQVELTKDVQVKGEGYEFCADGWDKQKNIGFEIPQYFLVKDTKVVDRMTGEVDTLEPAKELSEADDLKVLDEQVAKNKKNLFVYPQGLMEELSSSEAERNFRAFLQSVVDYLEWLRLNNRL